MYLKILTLPPPKMGVLAGIRQSVLYKPKLCDTIQVVRSSKNNELFVVRQHCPKWRFVKVRQLS